MKLCEKIRSALEVEHVERTNYGRELHLYNGGRVVKIKAVLNAGNLWLEIEEESAVL